MVKEHQVQMASRNCVRKDDDVEQQSIRLLQSDATSVRRDFNLKLTVLDIIEEGHKAAAVAIASSIVLGYIMGMILPMDPNIPGRLHSLLLNLQHPCLMLSSLGSAYTWAINFANGHKAYCYSLRWDCAQYAERYARASNVLGWTYFACWWIGW